MSIIKEVTTQPFSLAMKGNLSWGKTSKLTKLEHVLVKVLTNDGHVGVAEAPARPTIYGETPESIQVIVRDFLAPKFIGLNVNDDAGVWDALHSVANNQCAKGALDIAIHEARAKSQGKTLFDAQCGSHEKLRVSFILGISDLDTMLKEAQSIFEEGVSVFKIKVGRDAKHDAEVVGALNHVFAGEDVLLYADANEGLAPETAAQDLERLAKLGVAYIEEPLPVRQLKARAALKAENILPIIADDSCFSLADLERELDFDTFDILNIKTARTGYSESLKMLSLAESASKGVMVGSQASAGLGTLHAALFASQSAVTHPSELSFPLKLHKDILLPAFAFDAGFLRVSDLTNKTLVS